MVQGTMFSAGSSGLPRWIEGILVAMAIVLATAAYLTVRSVIPENTGRASNALVLLFLGSMSGLATALITVAGLVASRMASKSSGGAP